MKPVLELIHRVGPSDANVLLTGENGTGKSVVARTLHAVSHRSSRPMVTVNLDGLSEGVFESELFGHVRDACTDAKSDRLGRFELADGGTLFLDEIASVPLDRQRKLLRVLETGEFERVGSSKTKRALSVLKEFAWPGNIRELDHAVERAVLMSREKLVKVSDLGLRSVSDEAASGLEDMNLEEVERLLIHKALARYNGNMSHAAKALGLSRSALYRRLERYQL